VLSPVFGGAIGPLFHEMGKLFHGPGVGSYGAGGGGNRLGDVSEEVDGTSAVAKVGGVADGFDDELFGAANGFDRVVAKDEVAEERGGKSAAGAVGGGGFNVLAGEPVDISRGQTEEVGGLSVVAGGGDDVEVGVLGG
jgi:hypothetical protein